MTIPEWAKPLVAARERGATLQNGFGTPKEWHDEIGVHFAFNCPVDAYRIKPGTDPGERKVDPLIFGTVVPAFEPVVPVRDEDEYVPLTETEADAMIFGIYSATALARVAHRAGWERRRTP